jgi:hypothetical protein
LATKLGDVAALSAALGAEDARLNRMLDERVPRTATARPQPSRPAAARALDASAHFNPVATQAAGSTLRSLREAVDFPTFVTSLISGVFRSILSSNLQQLEALQDLLSNVSASAESFSASNINDAQACAWLVGRLPFLMRGDDGTLALRPDTELSDQSAVMMGALDATAEEVAAVDESELATTLVPLARRKMGRDRQQVLATMVMLGLQRVVVDDGRLHASMELQVDTRSAAEQMEASQFDTRTTAGASASASVGPWGASANVSTTVGYVRSDQLHTQEEIASRAGLRSSVDLTFRSEQVPLDRLADQQARQAIMARTPTPTSWSSHPEVSGGSHLSGPTFSAPPAPPAPPPAPPPATTARTTTPTTTTAPSTTTTTAPTSTDHAH